MCIELHLHVHGMVLGAMFDHTGYPPCCCTVWVVYPSRHYVVYAVVYSYVIGAGIMGLVTPTRGQQMVFVACPH